VVICFCLFSTLFGKNIFETNILFIFVRIKTEYPLIESTPLDLRLRGNDNSLTRQ
jgi:hypothetical protein